MVNFIFFFQAEDGIRDHCVTGVQTCALPIYKDDHSSLAQGVREAIARVVILVSPAVYRSGPQRSSWPRRHPRLKMVSLVIPLHGAGGARHQRDRGGLSLTARRVVSFVDASQSGEVRDCRFRAAGAGSISATPAP